MALVPESLPDSQSQRADYYLEATQVSQPMYSQTQASQAVSSQVEPRRKYWAILIPTNRAHSILKLPWSMPSMQIGRGPHPEVGNDLVLREKRVSNKHCRITLGLPGRADQAGTSAGAVWDPKEFDGEPQVWIEDLGSSNGTYNGDEISLGHVGTADGHDVRYMYRSVGVKGARHGRNGDAHDQVGEVYERYQLMDKLGKGTFAEVFKAVEYDTGNLRAIKQIVKHRFGHNPKTLQLFQREIQICTDLTHENICRLIEWYEDPQHICLVLEFIDGGDLLDYIMEYPGDALPEELAAELTWQICRAMAYCHEMGVTHRDLKPENILITKETKDQPSMVKIADFGLAKMVHTQTMLTSMVGTPQYLAPEVVMQTSAKPGYENVVDSWSVGIIVYSMLTKALPFDEDQELPVEQRIRARFDQSYDVDTLRAFRVTEDAVDFVGRLLERDPAKRMTMAQALEHPWLAQPSSQPESASQPAVLGGDSMWNIQSFDNADGPIEEGGDTVSNPGDEARRERQWTRPMTESAHLAGGLRSASRSRSPSPPSAGTNDVKPALAGSSESFSQPMQNLHLYTPMPSSGLGKEVDMGAKREEPADGDDTKHEVKREVEHEANGADDAHGAGKANGANGVNDINSSNGATDATASGNPERPAPATATATPGKAKRKNERSDWFSSGSLSPPPDDDAEASAMSVDLAANDGAGGAAANGQADVSAGDATAKADKGKGDKGRKKKVEVPTRSSPRRPRKSVRLG